FKKNPKMFKYVDVENDTINRKSVLSYVKGKKSSSNKTVVLIAHTDTVGASDYGTIKEYATNPLRLKEKLKQVSITENTLRDLESGKYLFGRGIFDMKCGLSTLITIVEDLSNNVEELEGNIVFAAVCDEEGNSGGMLNIVPELVKLRDEEGFEYQALVDT